jgi:CHAT domain-containing protein
VTTRARRRDAAEALQEAKPRLRDAKDEQGNPKHTLRDWAAWVLTGEPD